MDDGFVEVKRKHGRSKTTTTTAHTDTSVPSSAKGAPTGEGRGNSGRGRGRGRGGGGGSSGSGGGQEHGGKAGREHDVRDRKDLSNQPAPASMPTAANGRHAEQQNAGGVQQHQGRHVEQHGAGDVHHQQGGRRGGRGQCGRRDGGGERDVCGKLVD